MLMKSAALTIGRLARAAGVNVETIRYYQRVGLIHEPSRPDHGYRIYPMEVIEQIRFIKRAQQLGFRLQEIAELLELGEGRCDDVRSRAEHKRDQIDAQIRDLQALRSILDALIQQCQTGTQPQACPIVQTLAGAR